jgi:hypothetical protein
VGEDGFCQEEEEDACLVVELSCKGVVIMLWRKLL